MKLEVQYMAQLRTASGRSGEEVDLPDGSNLCELLVYLAALRADAAPHLVTARGQACPNLLLVVNGSAVPPGTAASVQLAAGDVVCLMPPIAGG
jgi:molybdopterin converting factor small subunit